MKFNVYFSRNINILTGNALNVDDEDVHRYEFIKPFHCFKLLKKHSIHGRGIEKTDDELVDAEEFFGNHDGKGLTSLAVVFVNSEKGVLYNYNCPTKRFNRLLLNHFRTSDFSWGIDVDKLEKIQKIEMKMTDNPQLSLLHDNIMANDGALLPLRLEMQDVPIKEANERGMDIMTAQKKQAFKLLQDVPDDKMNYVILILNGLNGLINGKADSNKVAVTELKTSADILEAWEGLRKYKGIIPCVIDEKAELAEARDKKYAHFN